MTCCGNVCEKLNRKKTMQQDLMETPLQRCLNIPDLTMIGVGNMVGAGVFLLSGIIARDQAGPGVVLSYILSGFAMCLTSLCYAEYGARVPKAGSAYTYTYMTLGEIWAFYVGWNVILARMLGAAALARGWSSMLDAMCNNTIRNATMATFGQMGAPGLSEYADFTALSVTLFTVVLVSVGIKFVAKVNMCFTSLNILTLCIIIGVGFNKADWNNWTSEALGGFLPYGFQGVVAGAATLFYSFVGFESITVAGEEAKDPATQIPIATMVAMLFTAVIYMLAGAALTLMIPFNQIDVIAPFPSAFRSLGIDWAVYVVSISALLAITTSIFMDLYVLPRNVYAMASDGLFCRILSSINPVTQTPVVATVVLGVCTAVISLLVEYKDLVECLSIANLSIYTMVTICVVVNRYRRPDNIYLPSAPSTPTPSEDMEGLTPSGSSAETHDVDVDDVIKTPLLKKEFEDSRLLMRTPGEVIIALSILCLIGCSAALGVLLRFSSAYDIYGEDKTWILFVCTLGLLGVFTSLFMISAYEETNEPKHFSVPLVPYLPGLSVIINVTLLVQLPVLAWCGYGVWLLIGTLVYFIYGIRHSAEVLPLASQGIPLVSYSAIDNTIYEEN